MKIGLEHGTATHAGLLRDNNEDFMAANKVKRLYMVADGLGGHEFGDLASEEAVEAANKTFNPDVPISLVKGFEAAKNALINARTSMKSNMDTTLTALHVSKTGTAHVVHVGDSRAYVLRGKKLRQLTTDHNLPFPWARNLLEKTVANKGDKPDKVSVETRNGDVFLLCSDGVHGQIKPNKIKEVLKRVAAEKLKPRAAAKELIKMANAAGGEDNATAVVVRVKHVTG